MKILVTAPQGVIRESFIPQQVRSRLESIAEVEYNTMDRNFTPEELRDRLHGVDVALTGWGTTLFDEAVLAGADRLKLIAHTGGSVTPVMSDEAYDRGIRVISGNEMYAESVAESVIAYALTALRRIAFLRLSAWLFEEVVSTECVPARRSAIPQPVTATEERARRKRCGLGLSV